MLADVRRLLDADGLGRVPVLATTARTGEGIAELRAEIARAGRGQEGDPRAARGRRAAGRGRGCSEASGDAPARDAGRRTADRGARRRLRRRRRRADRGRRRRARPPGCARRRATGWPVDRLASPAAARPAQAAAPRPRRGRPRSSPAAAARLVPAADPGAAGPRRRRGAGRRRRRVGAGSPGRGRDAVRRASVSRLARPRRPPRPGARRDRPRRRRGCPAWAGLVRVLQWLLLLGRASPARSGSAVLACRASSASPAATPRGRRRPAADGAAARRASCSGCCSALLCRVAGRGRPRGRGRGRPTGGCARRSPRWPTSWSSSPVEAELAAYDDGARRARARAALSRSGPLSVHSRPSGPRRPQPVGRRRPSLSVPVREARSSRRPHEQTKETHDEREHS